METKRKRGRKATASSPPTIPEDQADTASLQSRADDPREKSSDEKNMHENLERRLEHEIENPHMPAEHPEGSAPLLDRLTQDRKPE